MWIHPTNRNCKGSAADTEDEPPRWQSSEEPTIKASSPAATTGITARRAAVSAPLEVKQENLMNLGSTSTGSGAGRAWMRAAARQWRHTDRTLARSARQGRRPSTVPRMSAGTSAQSPTTVPAAAPRFLRRHFRPTRRVRTADSTTSSGDAPQQPPPVPESVAIGIGDLRCGVS